MPKRSGACSPKVAPLANGVARTKYCPREIALMWGVGRERVLTLIRNGDLPATNVAINRSGRPRYLVSLEDIKKFELRRAVEPDFQ